MLLITLIIICKNTNYLPHTIVLYFVTHVHFQFSIFLGCCHIFNSVVSVLKSRYIFSSMLQ